MIDLAPRESLLALRCTCRTVADRANSRLYRHLVFEDVQSATPISTFCRVITYMRVRNARTKPVVCVARTTPVSSYGRILVYNLWTALRDPVAAMKGPPSAYHYGCVVDVHQLHALSGVPEWWWGLPNLRLVRQTAHGDRSGSGAQWDRDAELDVPLPEATVVRFFAPNGPAHPFTFQGHVKRVILNVLHHPDAPHEALRSVAVKIKGVCDEVVIVLSPGDVPRTPIPGPPEPLAFLVHLHRILKPMLWKHHRVVIAGAETWDHAWLKMHYPLKWVSRLEDKSSTGVVRWWLLPQGAGYGIDFLTMGELRARIDDEEMWPLIFDQEATCS